MTKFEKRIQTALTNPQNLHFNELCNLCEHFGMKRRKSKSGHVIYKRDEEPQFKLSIQDDNGKAKPYQVKQLLQKLKEHGLYNFKEEE